MKTAVATFHRCINYGSYWQARCLLEGLSAHGLAPVLLDHRSRRADMAEWRCALHPARPLPSPAQDRPLYARKVRRFLDAVEALPRSRPVALDQPEAAEALDLLVVGSDEVWNFRHPWYAGRALFFGAGVPASRRIAYAGSFGNHPAAHGIDAVRARYLQAFDSVSVRDRNSQQLLTQALGSPPPLVLDPCLQFVPPQPAAAAGVDRGGGYAAVYGHGFGAAFADNALRWARHRGLRLVSIGYRNDWADEQWLTAGPLEFEAFMRDARAVLTNYFHGCVFALRLHKPFASEETAYRSIKVRDLLSQLGCTDRLVGAGQPAALFDALLDAPAPDSVYARLAERRAASAQWLSQALALPARRGATLAHVTG